MFFLEFFYWTIDPAFNEKNHNLEIFFFHLTKFYWGILNYFFLTQILQHRILIRCLIKLIYFILSFFFSISNSNKYYCPRFQPRKHPPEVWICVFHFVTIENARPFSILPAAVVCGIPTPRVWRDLSRTGYRTPYKNSPLGEWWEPISQTYIYFIFDTRKVPPTAHLSGRLPWQYIHSLPNFRDSEVRILMYAGIKYC